MIKFKVQVFAFDFGEIFKNTFCTEHLWTTAYIANNLEHFHTQVRNTVTCITPTIFHENAIYQCVCSELHLCLSLLKRIWKLNSGNL